MKYSPWVYAAYAVIGFVVFMQVFTYGLAKGREMEQEHRNMLTNCK